MNSEYREEADREPGDQKRCRSCQVGKFDLKNCIDSKLMYFGPLPSLDLVLTIRKEHFVMDSEYLVTLLVVVPLALQPDWNNRVG